MFYTSKSIRLVSVVKEYLLLIQEANNRHEDQRSKLARYDACDNWWETIRLMNKRPDITMQMKRWENISNWLVLRMQKVLMELNQENDKQLKKVLSTNETSIIKP